jgi:3-hydroxyisobutyrate dehydrogenase
MNIGIIGCGNMGSGMARTLRKNKYPVFCYDKSLDALNRLEQVGCTKVVSANDLTDTCNLIILSLPTAEIVKEIVESIHKTIKAGTVILDTSTSKPATTKILAKMASENDYKFIDGPVSGGPAAANSGEMTMLLGGKKIDINHIRPILDILTSKTVIVGPPGSGHAAKIANNMLCAANLILVSEVVKLGQKIGIEAQDLLSGINAGSGRSGVSEVNFQKWILNETYNSGFSMGLMRKDVKLGLELTEQYQVPTPAFNGVAKIWESSKEILSGQSDFNEIYKFESKND